MEKANLIQRIEKRRKTDSTRKYVDRHFSFDYMGSAEFEFGQLSKAMTQMLVDFPQFFKAPKRIDYANHICWFVGEEKGYKEASQFFKVQLYKDHAMHWPIKEPSYIEFAYRTSNNEDWFSLGERIIGWWCVDIREEIPPWAIFKYPEDAALWLDEITRAYSWNK